MGSLGVEIWVEHSHFTGVPVASLPQLKSKPIQELEYMRGAHQDAVAKLAQAQKVR